MSENNETVNKSGEIVLAVTEAMENKAVIQQDPTPMTIMQTMVEQGADPDALGKMMELQERWEANEAKKAFDKAVAEFKKNPPKVIKDMENKQYKSSYVSIENLVTTVTSALSQYGLSTRWEYPETGNDAVRVCCVLTHEMGHSESVCFSAPPDTSGAKNPIQQLKSTSTYLRIMTFEAVTGIVTEYGSLNDDGDAAIDKPAISDEQATELQAMCTDAGMDDAKAQDYLVKLAKRFGISMYTNIRAENFEAAKEILKGAVKAWKDKQK